MGTQLIKISSIFLDRVRGLSQCWSLTGNFLLEISAGGLRSVTNRFALGQIGSMPNTVLTATMSCRSLWRRRMVLIVTDWVRSYWVASQGRSATARVMAKRFSSKKILLAVANRQNRALESKRPPQLRRCWRAFCYTIRMSWAAGRRFIILCIVGAVVIAFLAAISIATFYKSPSCSDGKQNQDETGVDCGGSCAYLCKAKKPTPTVLL